MQRSASFDFDTLASNGESLRDLVKQSAVSGTGRIVDVRLGYQLKLGAGGPEAEADYLQRMFVVIKPEELLAGKDLLGSSGDVLVDLPAPAVDVTTGDRGIAQIRSDAVRSEAQVAFMLTPEAPPVTDAARVNEFAGREDDDPLLVPVHPSAVLGVEDGAAFPLLTTEKLQESQANLGALGDLGAKAGRFTTVKSQIAASSP